MKIELPKWYDLHAHFRQDDVLSFTVKDHVAMGCAGVLGMPNTKPPVSKVFESDPSEGWSVERYRQQIMDASDGAFKEVIVALYLTQDTTADMIAEGAKAGVLKACKYYPPHGTTGAEFGAALQNFVDNGVIAAMEEHGVTFCIHGEEHALPAERYFDRKENAEEIFYREHTPMLVDKFPNLRIVGEHLTTKVGVDFILSAPEHVKATVTPQHLLYTVGHLVQGLKYHLYCLPLVKFDEDRDALRKAVTAADNTKFFAGTDSAPHVKKVTPCGCAAGCYTGGIAPQLYAQAFEEAGVDLSTDAGQAAFKAFLCTIGQDYYDLPEAGGSIVLEKKPQDCVVGKVGDEEIVPLPMGYGNATMPWSLVSVS